MTDIEGKVCCGRMWVNYRYRTCGKKAKVEVDGKFYCGVHDPNRLAARAEAREKKWAAQNAAISERYASAKARVAALGCGSATDDGGVRLSPQECDQLIERLGNKS